MISQKCPKCLSSRVRRGYRKTPIYMKVVGRFYLLCDACNWEFTGFAIPGTVSSKPTRRKGKKSYGHQNTTPHTSETEDVAGVPSETDKKNAKSLKTTSGQ